MATPVGTLGTIPTLTIGGRVFSDLTTLIVLWGRISTSGNKTTLRKTNGTSGYAVTSGKTYTANALQFWTAMAATSAAIMRLLYTDNDLGMDGTTAATNPVYYCGDSSNGVGASAVAQNSQEIGGVNWPTIATKYPGIISLGSSNIDVFSFGYET